MLASSPQASAQAPKTGGGWYEDKTDLGFKVRTPKGWTFVPPSPSDKNMIGRYSPKGEGVFRVGNGTRVTMYYELSRFDRRNLKDSAKSKAKTGVEALTDAVSSWPGSPWTVMDSEDVKYDKIEGQMITLEGELEGDPMYIYGLVMDIHPECQLAIYANGPGGKNWKKYGPVYKKINKTLKRVDIEQVEVDLSNRKESSALRNKKFAELSAEVEQNPGWELFETENYFVVTSNPDKKFMKELMLRLEAIRDVYEETYPPEEAKETRRKLKELKAKENKGKTKPSERKSVVAEADPFELSRTSVVRVCSSQKEYMAYGAPGGSAGYWSSRDQELVVYDDKANGGRGDTWATLNHEAFHQYIFYFYGSVAPHSWYNEGTGDFYAGYQLKSGKFKVKPFDWRVGLIKTMIREERFVPLKEIVRYSQREYYSNSKHGTTRGDHYAQGWSFIYFLRTGKKKKAKGWNDDWNDILSVYLETLLFTSDHDAAVDKAFAKVDWEELTEAWIKYTK